MNRFKLNRNGSVRLPADYALKLGLKPVASDVYLFMAAKIPALGKEILKYYDPDNPTKEGIAAAKKYCKKDRQVAKIIQLASSYGAGPKKIHETLALSGIDISLADVRQIHRDYWRLFAGVKRFEAQLQRMWAMNGGYIYSVLGNPIPVAEAYLKDILNRFCQQSGHEFLQLWIYYINKLRVERGVEMYPWMVDFHDETIWEAPEDQAEAAAKILSDARELANDELAMDIRIKGGPEIADNLAQIKVDPQVYAEFIAQLGA